MKDLKYLAAYINPALAAIGLLAGGYLTYLNVAFVFLLVPVIDQFGPVDSHNSDKEEKKELLSNKVFDWLLYLNLPILYGIIFLFIYAMGQGGMTTFELVGNIISVGIVIATCGINVGHELGHRKQNFEKRIAQLLYLPALYIHFFIEHNLGHHKHVATDMDPASAKQGDVLYLFWFKSVIGGYKSAWKIEKDRMARKRLPFFSLKNEMIQFTFAQLAYLLVIYFLAGPTGLLVLMGTGVLGFLFLETINYVEHYGLRRKKLPSGRFERVQPQHSWNAEYSFGRIVLYELTRHSDHHFQASKKYQILDHYEEAPELPFGYPLAILISFIPPLWFSIMDKRIPESSNEAIVELKQAVAI